MNERLLQLGFEVSTIPFSKVIESRGNVPFDMLPVER